MALSTACPVNATVHIGGGPNEVRGILASVLTAWAAINRRVLLPSPPPVTPPANFTATEVREFAAAVLAAEFRQYFDCRHSIRVVELIGADGEVQIERIDLPEKPGGGGLWASLSCCNNEITHLQFGMSDPLWGDPDCSAWTFTEFEEIAARLEDEIIGREAAGMYCYVIPNLN